MWQLRPVQADEVAAIRQTLGVSDTAARLLWLRGCKTPEAARRFWLSREQTDFLTPIDAPGMQIAVARLRAAVASGEPIVVYGDYDADGVTATALLYRYLKQALGANVEAYLPDRFADGYGINAEAVARLHARGCRLIVTCDNGVSAHAAARAARELGVDLIVTDHHQPPAELPEATAIVHPRLGFAHLAELSGVGVALLVAIALEGAFTPRLESLLDLVALGTVADVVSLAGPNRALVWAGLQRIRRGPLRPGLRALIEATGHARPETLTARNIAFSLAPMLNAAGRVERPDTAFRLLVTDDEDTARELADALAAANEARRAMDRTLVEELCDAIAREAAHTGDDFLVLAGEHFHHGITGIVAGRLKERLRRPVLLLSPHRDGVWKGSGRSLEGCHLYEALASCADLLLGFGGHAMAAGCSVHESQIPALRARLNAQLAASGWSAPGDVVWLDACPPLAAYTPELLAELERFEPTGHGNPAPALGLLNARVLDARRDRAGKHLFVRLDDGESIRELPAWGQGEHLDALGPWLNAQLRPRWSTRRGLELAIDQLARGDGPARQVLTSRVPHARAQLADARGEERARVLRECVRTSEDLAIYTGERLPGLELERAIGARSVQYWSDRQAAYGAVTDLLLWERPYSLEAWGRLVAGVSGRVVLAWESPVVEPELSAAWLAAFSRELASYTHLSLPQVLAHPWEATTLMVRAGLEMLREAGLLDIDGPRWTLRPPEAPVRLDDLASYRTYREAHAFRVLLANADAATVRAALAGDRGLLTV